MSKHIYLIAGEPSGDVLGGRLMAALNAKTSDIRCSGVGGDHMTAQGLASYVPMDDLCVMGLIEIVKEYPRLRGLAYKIIKDIEAKQPDVVVTIDLPDFNFAIAKRLKQRGIYKGKIVHYVAPSVWAWRPGRAKKVAQFLDGLLCLFPFEPPYFEKHGLKSVCVGHSMVESNILNGEGKAFRERHDIAPDKTTIGVFFGSRRREIETHASVFVEALECFDNVHLIVPTLPRFEELVKSKLAQTNLSITITTRPEEKWDAFAAMDKGLAVSGTVGLELAYCGIPHVIAYQTSALNAFIARRMIQTPYVHLGNILLQKPAIPELLQEDCMPKKIVKALSDVSGQKENLEEIRSLLKTDVMPSDKAAAFVLGC
jgi:lipid-A-disaccharide synthase